jgi:hypothetical protein
VTEATDNLQLPYILPSQAQKHVTHNEAIRMLDATVQLCLADILDAPPGAPENGACYGIGEAPTGDWAGFAGRLAAWQDASWHILLPRQGWLGWCAADGRLHVHDGANWQAYGTTGSLPMLGVATDPDDTNRLAVAAEASLFSHAGADHRLKVNKAAAGDTASLLFQSGWSGRAEMGLAGNDRFSLKVSADGTTWTTAIETTSDGRVTLPQRPLAQASLSTGSYTPPDGTLTGFTDLSLAQGGVALGAPVPGGTGNRLIVPADGPYLLVLCLVQGGLGGACDAAIVINGTTEVAHTGAIAAAAGAKICTTAMVLLEKDDWLAINHGGAAPLMFGPDKTGITLAALA